MKRIALLILLVIATIPPLHAQEAPSPDARIVGPYLQNPTDSSMTVMWMTESRSIGMVEYGKTDQLDKVQYATRHGLRAGNTRLHKVKLTNLEPGARYHYRIISRVAEKYEPYKVTWGETTTGTLHSFQTLNPKAKSFSFLVFNDIHENVPLYHKLLNVAGEKPFDFVLFNGDILSHLENEEQIVKNFLLPCAETFAADTPFFYIRGNHETRGQFAGHLEDYLDMPDNRFHYTFSHGPASFIILDSGEDKEDSHWAYSGLADYDTYRTMQAGWLEAQLENKTFRDAPFRIVLSHMPLWGGNDWHGIMDCRTKWAPALKKAKPDLYLSGHTHRYKMLEPTEEMPYPLIIGGAPSENKATVIRVDINEKNLHLQMIRDDGVIVAEKTVSK